MGLYTPSSSVTRSHNRGISMGLRGTSQSLTFLLGDLVTALLCYSVARTLLGWGGIVLPFTSTLIWIGVWVIWRAYQGLYPGYGKSPQTELRLHTIGTVQLALVQLAGALALQKFGTSAVGIVAVWLLILLLSLAVRYLLRGLLIRTGRFGRPVSIIGAGRTAYLTIEHLLQHPEYGLHPVAAYDDKVELIGTQLSGIPVLGKVDEAFLTPITEQAIITIPGAHAEVRRRIINETYSTFPITWIVPDLFDVPNQAMQPHNIGSVASLEIKNNLRSARARSVKRTIDFVGSLLGTLLISPILLLIALVIKLDSPGPAVYRARRLGRDGELFDCFKFRSMHRDADIKLKEVLEADPALKAEFEATHKLKDDPRVTRVGAFLRKTSLDEFPQLFNVIAGQMSLVGPRPIVAAEIEKYGNVYEIYKQVRPGMTGYWQANGRSDTSYDERVAMDKFYVTNWTPWLDIIILMQTVKVVLLGKGAY